MRVRMQEDQKTGTEEHLVTQAAREEGGLFPGELRRSLGILEAGTMAESWCLGFPLVWAAT